jgi:hypothetical protein
VTVNGPLPSMIAPGISAAQSVSASPITVVSSGVSISMVKRTHVCPLGPSQATYRSPAQPSAASSA